MEYPSLSFLPLYTYIRALLNDSMPFKQSEYEQDRGKNCILSVPVLFKDNNETTEDGVVLPLDLNSELVVFDHSYTKWAQQATSTSPLALASFTGSR
jgi:hypothetical protein